MTEASRQIASIVTIGLVMAGAGFGSGATIPVRAAEPSSASASSDNCSQLTGRTFDHAEILSATSQSAGVPITPSTLRMGMGPGPATGLPQFCRVTGRIVAEPGSEIRFEVWMPSTGWSGRLNGTGVGGFAGVFDYLALSLAVKAGQVAVGTDTGHQASAQDSNWAKGQPQRVRDYGWRAIHLSTVAAKKLVKTFYGREPDHSYFVGCSGGGREGLMEAARFPEDYDGIVAGAPAANFTDLVMALSNPVQAQLPQGAAIRLSQAALLQKEVIQQCDAVDGQIDGLVADPRQCRFNTAKLACGNSTSDQCFSPAQIVALNRIYAGPHNRAGRQLTAAYLPSGAEMGAPTPMLGWEGYLLRGNGPSGGEGLVAGMLGNLVQTPFATPATFNYNRDPARLKVTFASDLDASPNLSKFFARGGKLILWHGWADAAIPPDATLRYRAAMLRQSGAKAKEASQLFMVPGVQHCMGGTGPGSFGQMNAPQTGDTPERSIVAALQAWVEDRRRPETLVARRGFGGLMGIKVNGPERQRLLCAYPKHAQLKPAADADQATSYTCI